MIRLVDQFGLDSAQAGGGLRARVMQLLLYAAFHQPVVEALRLAAKLVALLPASSGTDYVRLFVHYVLATQERPLVTEFARTVDNFAAEKGSCHTPKRCYKKVR